MKHKIIFFSVLLFSITISACLTLINHYFQDIIPFNIVTLSRWLVISVLIYYVIIKKSLTTTILVSMVIGTEFGYDFPEIAINLQVISKIFLSLIKTIIAPLLFGTLVVGIAGHSNLKQVGRMGWKSILYFEVVSTVALFIGLLAINISKAGTGVIMPPVADASLPEVKKQTWNEIILHIFPENIAKSVYEGQVLQIVVFSIIFGIAVAMLKDKHRNSMVHFAESLSETMFKFTKLVMYFAPVAVFAAIAYTVGHLGLDILVNLFKLLATLYVSLLCFCFLVLLPVALICNSATFLRNIY